MALPAAAPVGHRVRAEAAVLARDPAAARHLAQAKAHADRNPIAGALTPGCRSDPAGRTLILARNGKRATGEGELARIGATPLAAYRQADPPPGLRTCRDASMSRRRAAGVRRLADLRRCDPASSA
jgi:hypothetical protein